MRVVAALVVFVIYVAAGKLGLAFAFDHASATAVWPPAGIALAAVLLWGMRLWPAIFAGAFMVNITTAGTLLTSLGIATGNTLEALVAGYLARRFARGPAAFERAQDIFKLAGLAVAPGAAVSATMGVASLVATGHAAAAEVGSVWLTWWLGDASGMLLVTPLIVLWARAPSEATARRSWAETAAVFASIVIIAVLVFDGVLPGRPSQMPLAFVTIPALLWAAYRFGTRETSTALAVLAALAVGGTIRGWGPFAGRPPGESLLLAQGFLAVMVLTVLPMAAVVAERRRAEAAARLREEQLRVAVTAAEMGTWEWTIATGEVRWSPSLEAIHGLPPGGFAGTYEAFQSDIHPEDREPVGAAIRASLAGTAHRLEYRIVRPDGAVRWVEARGELFSDRAGRPERLVGVCLDVTARKRGEERNRVLADIARSISASLDIDTVLPRIAEGARALCESDTAAIFLRDSSGEAMVPRYRVGPWLRAYETLRIGPGEGLGGRVMESGRPLRTGSYRTDPRVSPALWPVADQAGTVALMVVPITTAGEVAGLLYISNGSARAFTDEDEAVSLRLAEQAAIAIQNARLYAREGAARAEAEAASRSKDEFLAMLSHELRNPLSAITNAVSVLERTDEPAAVGRAREIIGRQARHLGRLVDDLLDVSRSLAGKIVLRREDVDFAAVVERAVAALRVQGATDHHEVAVTVSSVHVDGDTVRLEQVATNLLENALKYTPQGGRLAVTVGAADGAAVLTVEDNGIGIAPALLPRIFDLFVQADDSLERGTGGLGIGLTLVRRIVELHGGTVDAVSPGAGAGSRFTVRLPATRTAPAHPGSPAMAWNGARRVLVVEDNDDAREMLCHLVRLLGHEVHQAADGADAVDAAVRLQPDVMLVDIGLPGVDGYEVARRVRAASGGRALRLVALTGYGRREDRERALAAGYDDHLVKPVDPARLAALLGEAATRVP